MPLDAAAALAAPPATSRIRWSRKDVQLYHLGIGAGTPATDPAELRYLLEQRLCVLPSFATVAGGGVGVIGGLDTPGVDVDLADVLHGAHRLVLHRPVPPEGTATGTRRVTAVHDKGKAAVLTLRTDVADAAGPLWATEAQLYLRGAGGFGGDRGTGAPCPGPPAGAPRRTVDRSVRDDQALLYRLSGDTNPLHADPAFAARAGFSRPILHGLCTYGIALKAVVDTELGGDVSRVRAYSARFSGVAYPGERLSVRMWAASGGVRTVVVAPERGDAVVLTGGVVVVS